VRSRGDFRLYFTLHLLFSSDRANMKRNLFSLTPIFIFLLLASCKQKAPADNPGASSKQDKTAAASDGAVSTTPPFTGGPKTSFQEVTSQLDPGGSLFLYLSTAQWLAGLSTNISQFRQVLSALPGQGMENRDQIEKVFELVSRLVKSSGIEDVSGVGVSAAPVAPGLFRNKLIVHHPEGSGKGFLWSMFGRAPHALGSESMLPTNTAIAAFADLDLAQVWQVLQTEMSQSGIPQAAEMARAFPQMFEKQTQIPWPALLESLGGDVGVVLTLDETKRISIPAGPRNQMDLPAPGLLFAVKIKNDLLYERISAKLSENPKAIMSEEKGLKICSMPLDLPIPIAVQPTLASSGDYFYFASSPELVRTVQAVRQGKGPGLKGSAKFQNLAKHLPAEGNQFIYVDQIFGETVRQLQSQAMSGNGMGEEQLGMFRRLLGGGQPAYSLAIGAHTTVGWQTTSVGNQDSASAVMLVPAVGATAVGAGLLLPALAKAKGRAQTITSVSQLKQLGLAARMYANDHQDKFPNAKTWCDDLQEIVGNPKTYKAPNDQNPGRCSYAYNERLSGMEESKISPQTVLFFEADGDWNLSGGPDLLLTRPRSGNLYVIGFADGSVQQLQASRIRSLRWNP
jgi:hypothetical protein